MRESKDGNTVGITLRISKRVLAGYTKIALRANSIAVKKGCMANLTVQDVIRHRLASLPFIKADQQD
jgi:hypothetical protein